MNHIQIAGYKLPRSDDRDYFNIIAAYKSTYKQPLSDQAFIAIRASYLVGSIGKRMARLYCQRNNCPIELFILAQVLRAATFRGL